MICFMGNLNEIYILRVEGLTSLCVALYDLKWQTLDSLQLFICIRVKIDFNFFQGTYTSFNETVASGTRYIWFIEANL